MKEPFPDEDGRDEGVPLDGVDGAVVGPEGGEDLLAVLGGAEVDQALVRPYQVLTVVLS